MIEHDSTALLAGLFPLSYAQPMLLLLVVFGCATPPLAPAMDLYADPMTAALPRRAWLIGGADMRALQGSAAGAALWADLPVEAWEEVERWTGTPEGPEQIRLGCGDAGCVVLAEGDFSRWTPDVRVNVSAQTRDGGLDLTTPVGPLVLRRLDRRKLVGGDRAAVAALAQQQAAGQDFDPATLDGFIPEGDLWLAATSAEGVAALVRRVAPTRLPEVLPDDLPNQLAVSVRLDAEGGARVVVRARSNAGEIAALRARAEVLAARAELEPGVGVEVRAADPDVELVLEIEPEALAAAVERGRVGGGTSR